MITIFLEDTTKNPITTIGKYAGVCYGSNIADNDKNYKRGLDCFDSGHGRVLESVKVSMIIDGYSAKFCRELYTHVGGSPMRLQSSTRYIDYALKGFDYVTPPTIESCEAAKIIYEDCMNYLRKTCLLLENINIPKEDASMLLPLGMTSKMVWNGNLRCLLEMSHQRMCARAYWEYRKFMKELCLKLSEIDEEWKFVVSNYFMPKCKISGYCTEKFSCGAMPKKSEMEGKN